MLLTATLVNAIAGALWRRWLGGWLGGRRSIRFMVMPILCWPMFVALPVEYALPLTIAMGVFWSMGHTVDSWTVWLRYGPGAIGYVAAKKWWPSTWRVGNLIDGWMAVGELWAGAIIFGLMTAICLL